MPRNLHPILENRPKIQYDAIDAVKQPSDPNGPLVFRLGNTR